MSKDAGSQLSDQQVIQKVLDGDLNLYAVIVERYEAKLMRYATFLVKDYDIASDIVQDSFIKAYENLNSFKLNRAFSSWIYRIVHNETMNVIAKNKKIMSLPDYDTENDGLSVDFSADKVIDSQMLGSSVQNCMKNIDVKYKEVLVLYYFENLKYDEISDILHVPVSTVGVRIKRAKAELKKVCKSEGVKYD
jgi:RNA polymerase sigma-70 factor (ECF subfamily)